MHWDLGNKHNVNPFSDSWSKTQFSVPIAQYAPSNHQKSAGSYCYLVFGGICLSVAVYVYIVIPETKNKTFMEISRIFSKKEAILETQGLTHIDQLKLKKMNGYGGLEHTSLEFDSSSSVP